MKPFTPFIALAATLALSGQAWTALADAPAATGYLGGQSIGYTAPPPPTAAAVLEIDLEQVRAAQTNPSSARWLEAFSDAQAYYGADIIRRFGDAAGAPLDPEQRPLLTAMLQRIIVDASAIAQAAKTANSRPRPYVEDPGIAPCNTNFLKPTESYPSGHAMNGYVVAKVLGEVFHANSERLLARGLRYGDNRVVCGVHHPIDIQQGRLLGVAYLEILTKNAVYQADLACARQEDAALSPAKIPLSPACAARRQSLIKAAAERAMAAPQAAAELF
jgi:acid phosphatase (class A)